jgi:hypothetical protein
MCVFESCMRSSNNFQAKETKSTYRQSSPFSAAHFCVKLSINKTLVRVFIAIAVELRTVAGKVVRYVRVKLVRKFLNEVVCSA